MRLYPLGFHVVDADDDFDNVANSTTVNVAFLAGYRLELGPHEILNTPRVDFFG